MNPEPELTMKNIHLTVFLLLAAATLAFSPSSAGEPAGAVPPDFTAGGKKDDSHDWLLGPTGLRGWMFFRHEDLTAASRQILVTAVDKGSPADGILQVNDVILGVFGKTSGNRKALNKDIAAIEAAKDAPKLVSLKNFIANASKSNP